MENKRKVDLPLRGEVEFKVSQLKILENLLINYPNTIQD